MKSIALKVSSIIGLMVCLACTQSSTEETILENATEVETEVTEQNYQTVKVPRHNYGAWYCPDNLRGFPPVDIANWKNVLVVNGRMATEEETGNGTSLIQVDMEKFPNTKTLDLIMPRLATFESPYTDRKEIIIVIQALNIDDDSIVGFRYLNGGNGSARLDEVKLLSDAEVNQIEKSKFFTHSFVIMATPEEVKEALTSPENASKFQTILESNQPLKSDWRKQSNVNYHYPNTGDLTSSYADMLFGNFYVQNDYQNFTEKFLVTQNELTKMSILEVVCGPFTDDFEKQEALLLQWGKQVQLLSEKK